MEAIKQWMICIVFCSLITAVINILTPKSSTQRAVKTIVSSFMICAFLSPFISGGDIDIEDYLPNFSDYQASLSAEISTAMLEQAEKESEKSIEELLIDLNVEFENIAVKADIDSENSIYVREIVITLDKKYSYREKQITSNLKAMFLTEAEYVWVKK